MQSQKLLFLQLLEPCVWRGGGGAEEGLYINGDETQFQCKLIALFLGMCASVCRCKISPQQGSFDVPLLGRGATASNVQETTPEK